MAASPGRNVRDYANHFVILCGMVVFTALAALHPALAAPYAAYVMDARTGETLYSQNAETRLHPASLTKMMTLYITFQEIERGRISLDTMVTVSKNAAGQPPSRLGLKPGQKIAVRYLIRAAAVKSANDAASALGDFIGGNEAKFATRMTKTARALGMKNTTFKNANGLTAPGHLSTAHDMSILGRRLFYDFPQYYNIFSRRSVDAGLAQVASTNRRFLDAYKGADGIKTGYTVAAGFNLVASAERGNKRVIATVFGGSSTAQRNQKVSELLDLGFGKAPERARINPPPVMAKAPANDLMAEPAPQPAKDTVVAMSSSQRPQSRPNAEKAAAAAVAVAAMQSDIAGALAEAIAPPAEAAEPPPPGTLDAQVAELAAAPAEAPAPEVRLAAGGMSSSMRPAARPARQGQPAVPSPTAPAAAEPAPKTATEAPAVQLAQAQTPAQTSAPPSRATATAAPLQPDAGSVVDLSAPASPPASPFATASAQTEAMASGAPVEIASAAPARNAPIFDTAAKTAVGSAAETEVVTRISTSGGRHYGINVGRFNTRTGAESALTKTLLAESATLKGALRKVVEGNRGGYEANFMGLSQDQADLACARLQARSIQCFAIGE